MDTNTEVHAHESAEHSGGYISTRLADLERRSAKPKWPKRKMPPGPISGAVEEKRAARDEVERAHLTLSSRGTAHASPGTPHIGNRGSPLRPPLACRGSWRNPVPLLCPR